MNERIFRDAAIRGDIFRWRGGLAEQQLEAWIKRNMWKLPEDLVAFWVATGGGEIFESEILLCPFPSESQGDVLSRTISFTAEGLAAGHLVFHEGLGLSAVDQRLQEYVHFTDVHSGVDGRFESFESWYTNLLREEYKERYGLSP